MGLDAMEPTSQQQQSILDPAWRWDARAATTAQQQPKHVAAYPDSSSAGAAQPTATTSSRLRRKSSASRLPMRKSMSDKPLQIEDTSELDTQFQYQYQYHNSASLRSVADADGSLQNQLENELSSDPEFVARRQRIMARAEEILRGKRHVGMQFGETCPVCLADDVDTQLTQCGHRIHAKCIKRWMQSGTRCPVCREQVTGVEEAFTPPSRSQFTALEKDRCVEPFGGSDDASTSHDDEDAQPGSGGFEWGWFEDFDEFDEQNDASSHFTASGGLLTAHARRASMPNFSFASMSSSSQALVNRELSGAFEICRTFPPLRPVYDAPYACSPHAWMRVLPSHRHIAAKIQIRSFRIVEARASQAQHAEYLVELQLDGRYFSRWRRFSAISAFVRAGLGSSEFRQTHVAWNQLEASSRWFNRLELSYLHERCKLLEQFAHTLLIECTTANPLADLLGS